MARGIRGFTLIELLVVIAIIAILAAILFPVFARVQESGRTTKCASNMKQINMALLAYVDDYGGRFPDSNNMYVCRVFSWYHGIGIKGPYIQDLLIPYIKNNAVWLCPSVRASDLIPPPPDDTKGVFKQNKITYSMNTGTTLAGKSVPSNYAWNHIRYTKTSAGSIVRVSGSLASSIVRPTKAVMFMEFPYWTPTPHKVSDGKGYANACMNMVFYDGHVKLTRATGHAWAMTWEGWEY